MKGLPLAMLLTIASSLSPLSAETVAVALIESPGELGAKASRLSELVVAGALDALFDSGIICSDDAPRVGDIDSFLSYEPSDDAAEGLIDYIIVVFAEHGPASAQPSPPSCSYRLIRVRDGAELTRGAVPVPSVLSPLLAEIEKACSAVGASIANSCSEAWRGGPVSWRKHEYVKA